MAPFSISREGIMDTTIKNDLIEVRKLINKGWCKKVLAKDKNGGFTTILGRSEHQLPPAEYCVTGALLEVCYAKYNMASEWEVHPNERIREIEKLIELEIACFYSHNNVSHEGYGNRNPVKHSVPYFNDDPTTSKEMVLEVLDQTIEKVA